MVSEIMLSEFSLQLTQKYGEFGEGEKKVVRERIGERQTRVMGKESEWLK